MTGILGVLITLALLMYLAYRGISGLILAPLMAMLAVLFEWGTPLLASFTQVFMTATGDFIVLYFPLFLLGAIFGKLMDDSGSAQSIARWTIKKFGGGRSILAIVLSCAVLTYGGYRCLSWLLPALIILVPERKPSFSPISASGSNFNPQNTPSIPAVKIFAVLDLDEKSWFSFGHYFRNPGIVMSAIIRMHS